MFRLKQMGHTFVQVQLDPLTSRVQRLVQPNEIAEEDFLGAALNECGWVALGVVAIHRRYVGVFLIAWACIGRRTRGEVSIVIEDRIRMFERDVGITRFRNVRPWRPEHNGGWHPEVQIAHFQHGSRG